MQTRRGDGAEYREEAFAYRRARMRPPDLECIGVFTGDDPPVLEKAVRLFQRHSRAGAVLRGRAVSGR